MKEVPCPQVLAMVEQAIGNASQDALDHLVAQTRSGAVPVEMMAAALRHFDGVFYETPCLRAAYVQMLDAFEKGASAERLEKVLDVVFHERMRYFANSIAQTELHRAYSDQQAREFMADDMLDVVQVRMSAAHPKTDICDLHSRLDKYGLGPGCYPKARTPKPPFHTLCMCTITPRWDLSGEPMRERTNAEQAFLVRAGEKDGVLIMGSRENWTMAINGTAVEDIINAAKDPMYHLQLVGDVRGFG